MPSGGGVLDRDHRRAQGCERHTKHQRRRKAPMMGAGFALYRAVGLRRLYDKARLKRQGSAAVLTRPPDRGVGICSGIPPY